MRRLKLTEVCQQRFIKALSVSLPVFVFASLVGSAWGQESVNIVDFNWRKESSYSPFASQGEPVFRGEALARA